MSENTIKAIINAKKSGKSYAAIDFVASNPELWYSPQMFK